MFILCIYTLWRQHIYAINQCVKAYIITYLQSINFKCIPPVPCWQPSGSPHSSGHPPVWSSARSSDLEVWHLLFLPQTFLFPMPPGKKQIISKKTYIKSLWYKKWINYVIVTELTILVCRSLISLAVSTGTFASLSISSCSFRDFRVLISYKKILKILNSFNIHQSMQYWIKITFEYLLKTLFFKNKTWVLET